MSICRGTEGEGLAPLEVEGGVAAGQKEPGTQRGPCPSQRAFLRSTKPLVSVFLPSRAAGPKGHWFFTMKGNHRGGQT